MIFIIIILILGIFTCLICIGSNKNKTEDEKIKEDEEQMKEVSKIKYLHLEKYER